MTPTDPHPRPAPPGGFPLRGSRSGASDEPIAPSEEPIAPSQAPIGPSAEPIADERVAELTARVDALEREREGLYDFTARAAHELVAPLVMIEAYSAMIDARLEHTTHGDVLHDVDAVARASANARRLVEALLAEARAESIEWVPVDLAVVLADVERTLAPELAERHAHVEAGELPTVIGEPALLQAVFMNLVVNAVRYGPRDRMRLRVQATAQPPDLWRVAFLSNGPPIPRVDRERIFAPYQRGRHERRMRGAGLGLAISRRIVERHGGSIGVDADADGNRFWFTLPAR